MILVGSYGRRVTRQGNVWSLIMVGKGRRWLLLVLDAGANFFLVLDWNGGPGGLAGGQTLLDPDLWSQSMGLPCT